MFGLSCAMCLRTCPQVSNWMNKSVQCRSAPLGRPSGPYRSKIVFFNQLFRKYSGHFDSTKIRSTWSLKANRQKQPNSTSTNKWLGAICYIHKVEYYLAIEKMRYWYLLQHVSLENTKVSENTMVSEKNSVTKPRIVRFYSYAMSRRFTET